MNNMQPCIRHIDRGYLPIVVFFIIAIFAIAWPNPGTDINILAKSKPPSFEYWFGTDWLGRDVFSRSLKALLFSLYTGGIASIFSAILAMGLAILGSVNSRISWLVDLAVDTLLSLPHLLLLILLTLVLGGGLQGMILAVTISHWPKLTRLLKTEITHLSTMPYIALSRNFGQPYWKILLHHFLPHLAPQWLTGLLILYPHSLLHMAGLTFLGFGVEPSTPTMGAMLSEASGYLLTGQWWLALLPGITLIGTLFLLVTAGQRLSHLLRPESQYRADC